MAFTINTHIDIDAPRQRVWQVLTDFDRYPEWNPFVQSLSGQVQEGQKIKIQLPGMTFRPTVLAFRQNEELRWLGHFLVKGLFDGEHFFQLTSLPNGQTRLTHGEHFSGLLTPIFKKQLLTTTEKGFAAMNQALRKEVQNMKSEIL